MIVYMNPPTAVFGLDVELLRVIRTGQLATPLAGATSVSLTADPWSEYEALVGARFDQGSGDGRRSGCRLGAVVRS